MDATRTSASMEIVKIVFESGSKRLSTIMNCTRFSVRKKVAEKRPTMHGSLKCLETTLKTEKSLKESSQTYK